VYEIALTVAACLRAGTRVDVAWVVDAQGLGARDVGEALAVTPGGGRVGSVLGGALDDQLVDLATQGLTGRVHALQVGDFDAQLAGLACGGAARCVLVPATALPWFLLRCRFIGWAFEWQLSCIAGYRSGDGPSPPGTDSATCRPMPCNSSKSWRCIAGAAIQATNTAVALRRCRGRR